MDAVVLSNHEIQIYGLSSLAQILLWVTADAELNIGQEIVHFNVYDSWLSQQLRAGPYHISYALHELRDTSVKCSLPWLEHIKDLFLEEPCCILSYIIILFSSYKISDAFWKYYVAHLDNL